LLIGTVLIIALATYFQRIVNEQIIGRNSQSFITNIIHFLSTIVVIFPLETLLVRLQLDAATIGPNQYTSIQDISQIKLAELYNGFAFVVIVVTVSHIISLIISRITIMIAQPNAGTLQKLFGNIFIPNVVLPLCTYPLNTISNRLRVNGTNGFKSLPLEELATYSLFKGLLAGRVQNAVFNRLQPKIIETLKSRSSGAPPAPVQPVAETTQEQTEEKDEITKKND
jgi:uncharacterized membrane protein YhaH (DUF805 family)